MEDPFNPEEAHPPISFWYTFMKKIQEVTRTLFADFHRFFMHCTVCYIVKSQMMKWQILKFKCCQASDSNSKKVSSFVEMKFIVEIMHKVGKRVMHLILSCPKILELSKNCLWNERRVTSPFVSHPDFGSSFSCSITFTFHFNLYFVGYTPVHCMFLSTRLSQLIA